MTTVDDEAPREGTAPASQQAAIPEATIQEAAVQEDIEHLEEQSFTEVDVKTRADLRTLWRGVIFALGLLLSLFHLYTAAFGTLPSHQQRTFHVAFGLGLSFLLYPAKQDMTARQRTVGWVVTGLGFAMIGYLAAVGIMGPHVELPAALVLAAVQGARHLPVRVLDMPVADLLLAALGMAAGLYLFFNSASIIRRAGIHNEIDLAIGTIGVLLVLVAAQRVVGSALVVVAGTMLAYAYFGPFMPGFLNHRGFTVDRIVATSFLGTEGVFGTPIAISSTFIFLFMIFAALLQRTGMERFFTRLALGMAGGMTGGTAKVGVLTSAFSGMITGSSVANTVSNGAFTIPMMKRSGYKPDFAGAVEASSSTGGQLAPPIMGAAAFIMVEFTGIPYIEIIKAAAIPAVLFFVAQYIVIHYESKRQGIHGLPKSQLPRIGKLLLTQGYLLAPIILIFIILSFGRSPISAAVWAIGATIAVNILAQLVALAFGTERWRRLSDKLTPLSFAEGLVSAARIALPIIAACAAAGLIAGVITLTGLGLKLVDGLLALSQHNLYLVMLFAMISCLVLGIGLPTTANYVITATLAAPALLAFDQVPVLAAHLFVYYFGVIADITPPVCLAAYAAAGISGGNPIRTGVQSFRIAISGFLVPYMFVLSPELLMLDVTWLTGIKVVATALIGVTCLGAAVAGHINRDLSWPVRVLLLGAGLALLSGEFWTDLAGVLVAAAVFGHQWFTTRRLPATA
ncbi:MAG: TRAP transporter permease [Micromonosporaceae bacterium]